MDSETEKIRKILQNFHEKLFVLRKKKEDKLNEFKQKLEEKKVEEIKSKIFE